MISLKLYEFFYQCTWYIFLINFHCFNTKIMLVVRNDLKIVPCILWKRPQRFVFLSAGENTSMCPFQCFWVLSYQLILLNKHESTSTIYSYVHFAAVCVSMNQPILPDYQASKIMHDVTLMSSNFLGSVSGCPLSFLSLFFFTFFGGGYRNWIWCFPGRHLYAELKSSASLSFLLFVTLFSSFFSH